MRRCWPKGTPIEAIPPDAEGVTWDEWRAQEMARPLTSLVDPILARDRAKRLAAEAERAARKKGGKR